MSTSLPRPNCAKFSRLSRLSLMWSSPRPFPPGSTDRPTEISRPRKCSRRSRELPTDPLSFLRVDEFPVPFGDDVDVAVNDLDGGLIVDQVRGIRYRGSPFLRLGHAVLRHGLVVQVRKDREVNDAQRFVAASRRG